MPTSTGKLREMTRIGTLEFTFKGAAAEARGVPRAGKQVVAAVRAVLRISRAARKPTRPAATWISIRTPTGIYIVDFNIAYHPYCYYNAEYDCPFPPAENRLKMPIRAGERLRKRRHDGRRR